MFETITLSIDARALVGNPLGDPTARELPIIVPRARGSEPLPLVFLLSGYSSVGRSLLTDDPWSEGLVQRMNRLAAEGKIGPLLVALPDCFTRYGGSQYLNSAATGRYEDHLWQDLLPTVRARFSTGRIGVAGKSSGGFGALTQAMRHPEIVAAAACHSGDLYFEYSYLPDLPKAVRTLRLHGGIEGFLAHFAASPKKRQSALFETMNVLAMAACYSPDPESPHGFALPFDLETGALRDEVWRRWLSHDPIRMLDRPEHVDALRRLRLLFIDCGTRDEYHLDIGARIFCAKASSLGVARQHEEFSDGHMGTSYRYDVSLPLLWDALRS